MPAKNPGMSAKRRRTGFVIPPVRDWLKKNRFSPQNQIFSDTQNRLTCLCFPQCLAMLSLAKIPT